MRSNKVTISTEELLAGSRFAELSPDVQELAINAAKNISTDDLIAASYAGQHGYVSMKPNLSPAQMAKAVAHAIIEGDILPDYYGMSIEHQVWIEAMIVNPDLAYSVEQTSEYAVALHMSEKEVIDGLHYVPTLRDIEENERALAEYINGDDATNDADEDKSTSVKFG